MTHRFSWTGPREEGGGEWSRAAVTAGGPGDAGDGVLRGPAAMCISFPEPEGARPCGTQTSNLSPLEL